MAVAIAEFLCYTEIRGDYYGVSQRTGPDFATDETGKLLAEVTFPEQEGIAVINHTFVDGSLRGQGVAGQLLRAVADTLRQDGRKAKVTCSYAVHWFETHPEEQDLLG